jgi:hypothetical protein
MAAEVGVDRTCDELGVRRRALYYWIAHFATEGISGLVDGSRRPRRLRIQIPAWVDLVIIAIRLHTYWNSKRIAAEMMRREIYKVGPDHITVSSQLAAPVGGLSPDPPVPATSQVGPNELWHVDIKGPFFINLGGRDYIKTWTVGLVDEHSRFVIDLRILNESKAAPILKWLDESFELYGHPIQLMSDNGQPFVTWLPGMLTLFGKKLRDL